jgi:formiminoglutamase
VKLRGQLTPHPPFPLCGIGHPLPKGEGRDPARSRDSLTPVRQIIGSRLKAGSVPSIVLAGFPSDEGVRRNHGRPGASLAPRAIRDALHNIPSDRSVEELLSLCKDLGDIQVTGDLEADQARLAEAIAPWIRTGAIPIILGGGHETAYGHFLAHVNAGNQISILNWDAHPDVRPLVNGLGHSGSPFRQAISHDSGTCTKYVVAGLLEARLGPEHLQFIKEHHGQYYWKSQLSEEGVDAIYRERCESLMTSFDMDAVDQSTAPGVSAPANGGLSAELWLRAAYGAGRHPRTLSMDLVEVNPKFDVEGHTVKLAAQTVMAFLRGVAERNYE